MADRERDPRPAGDEPRPAAAADPVHQAIGEAAGDVPPPPDGEPEAGLDEALPEHVRRGLQGDPDDGRRSEPAASGEGTPGDVAAQPTEAGPGDAEPVEPEPVDPLAAALADAERRRDEYLDALRRERAEFENFRKRTARERLEALDRGAEQLVGRLVGVLDNLGFALDAADASADEQLAKGVQLVASQLLDVLREAGLEEIDGAGAAFDPTVHEAVLHEAAEEPRDEPVVVDVLRTGYRFKGRVLRPASVKVAG